MHRLRQITDDDHEWLIELHNDPLVLRNLTHPEPITFESHMLWWSKISKEKTQLRLIYESEGSRVGLAKFYDIDLTNMNCILGGDIHNDYRGRGHAKRMWRLMLSHAFDDMGLHRVSLTTAAYNDVARSVYSSFGFIEEGRFIQSLYRGGVYHDQVLMYMLKETWNKNAT